MNTTDKQESTLMHEHNGKIGRQHNGKIGRQHNGKIGRQHNGKIGRQVLKFITNMRITVFPQQMSVYRHVTSYPI
jgi:hypothetical protein